MTQRPKSRQPIPGSAEVAFKGKLFDVYRWTQELYNGQSAVFEKLSRPDTAYVIPVREDGRLLLVEQKQPGSEKYIGLIGGRIETDEIPIDGARRELA